MDASFSLGKSCLSSFIFGNNNERIIDTFEDLCHLEITQAEKIESISKQKMIENQLRELTVELRALEFNSKSSFMNAAEKNKLELEKVIIKSKISFLSGFKPVDICLEKKSTQIIKYSESIDQRAKEIAVIKLPVKESYLQSLGYYTFTSQKSITSGAGSQNREACAGKAGFMIADKFHNALISYLSAIDPLSTPCLLDQYAFTPMITGITSLIDYELKQTAKYSIAVFCKNAIEAGVADEIGGILNKQLTLKELLKFQLFTIYDYLLGNTDRHTGNWMVKLSFKGKILNKEKLKKAVKEEGYTVNDLTIEEIIPIDNGNILPKQQVNRMICDSKQYLWKNLEFSQSRFSIEMIEFLKKCNLDDTWVDQICNSINFDADIKELCKDATEIFVSTLSVMQMKLRVKQINKVITREIKTPRELAEAVLG